LTPDEFNLITLQTVSLDKSWPQILSLSVNGELFNLSVGPLRLAGVTEFGSQNFSNTPDAQINQGVFFNQASNEGASGSCKRYALGS